MTERRILFILLRLGILGSILGIPPLMEGAETIGLSDSSSSTASSVSSSVPPAPNTIRSIPVGGAVQDTPTNPRPTSGAIAPVADPDIPIPADNGVHGTGTPPGSSLRGTDNP